MRGTSLALFALFAVPGAYADGPAPASPDEKIVLVENETKKKKVGEFLKKLAADEIDGFTPEVKLDLVELANLGVSIGSSIVAVSPEEVQRNPDRLYYDYFRDDKVGKKDADHALNHWYTIKFSVETTVPASLSLTNVVGPFGFDLGAKIGHKRSYAITTKTRRAVDESDTLLEDALRKLAMPVDTFRAIRIPRSGEGILRSFHPGTTIQETAESYLKTTVGLNAGVGIASAHASLSALVHGKFTKSVKIHFDSSRPYVNLVVSNVDTEKAETEESIKLGVTLFETSFIDGALSVEVVSATQSTSFANGILYDFTYDLAYPGAEKALTAALAGDLEPTQKLAIVRAAEADYRGVILNRQKTDAILKKARELSILAATHDESGFVNYLEDLMFWEKIATFGGIFSEKASRTVSDLDSSYSNFHSEKGVQRDFAFERDLKRRHLWGRLAERDLKIRVKSQVIASTVVDEQLGPMSIDINKLSFSRAARETKRVGKKTRRFLDLAARTLGWSDPALDEAIRASGGSCRAGETTMEASGSFYPRAIERMAAYSEAEVWSAFGRFTGLKVPAALRYSSTREGRLREAKGELRDLKRRIRELPDNAALRARADGLSILLENERRVAKHLLPALRAARALLESADGPSRREALAGVLRDLFAAFDGDSFLFAFLGVLAGGDADPGASPADSSQGSFLRFRVKGPGCSLEFKRSGDVLYQFGDVAKEW